MSERTDEEADAAPEREVDIDLPADLRAPGVARTAAAAALRRWRLLPLLDAVLIAVSELVTNAVRHGKAPAGLRLVRGDGRLSVDVRDASPEAPALDHDDALANDEGQAESGRGIGIVAAVSDVVAVHQVPDDGKVVSARLDTDAADRLR